jgi:hypothetical protein
MCNYFKMNYILKRGEYFTSLDLVMIYVSHVGNGPFPQPQWLSYNC